MFEIVATVPIHRDRARVFEHGWQSWTPTTTYSVDAAPYRPRNDTSAVMGYRGAGRYPARGFQGEGLLAIDPGDGSPVWVFAAPDPVTVPAIRAEYRDGTLSVSADGPVHTTRHDSALTAALGGWAEKFARAAGIPTPRPAPTGWCSWYQYYTSVTEADVLENLTAIGSAGLPVDVIQIDDGWQAGIGDWTSLSDRFGSLPNLARRLHEGGRRAGIWVAPFLAGARSRLAREHPDWLLTDEAGNPVDAGHNWDQALYGLDATNPGVAAYLTEVFSGLVDAGFDYVKLDFLYAGALDAPRADGSPPLVAYRTGLRTIRDALGPAPYIVGCGAPILPSVGLVDAMRVSADIALHYEAAAGDPSLPSQLGATLSTVARAFLHGWFWVNDPDCVIVRPAVQRREDWADTVARYGGLRVSSDRIADLDAWGLARTRELLATPPPPTPLPLD
jgi:alpha-galactosidase